MHTFDLSRLREANELMDDYKSRATTKKEVVAKQLSDRNKRIIELYKAGLPYKTIASRMGLKSTSNIGRIVQEYMSSRGVRDAVS